MSPSPIASLFTQFPRPWCVLVSEEAEPIVVLDRLGSQVFQTETLRRDEVETLIAFFNQDALAELLASPDRSVQVPRGEQPLD